MTVTCSVRVCQCGNTWNPSGNRRRIVNTPGWVGSPSRMAILAPFGNAERAILPLELNAREKGHRALGLAGCGDGNGEQEQAKDVAVSHRRDLLTRGLSAPRFPPRTRGCAGAESLTKSGHRPIMGALDSARPYWPPPVSTPPRSVRQLAQ